jgi:hypothetical protein
MSGYGHDVIVVGAGPAGLAAACRAAECGATVALLDDHPRPGGQIWRAEAHPKGKAGRWLRLAGACSVGWIAGGRVLGFPAPGRMAVKRSNGDLELDLSLTEGQIAGYAAAGQPEAAGKLFRARQSQVRRVLP